MHEGQIEHRETAAEMQPPVSVSHLVHTLRAYAAVIILSVIGVGIAYGIVAVSWYLMAPSQSLTSMRFRLVFRGAPEGKYPNGTRFSPTDITSASTVLVAYQNNGLDKFVPFEDFTHAIFVLESSPDYEKLANDYQSRLSDPRLSSVDRDRLQKEFESKRDAVAKDEYSINFLRTAKTRTVPETLIRKSLNDILQGWNNAAINEMHVLDYRINLYSPSNLDTPPTPAGQTDYILAIQILRTAAARVLLSIDSMATVSPGSEVVHTAKDKLTLSEIQARIQDLLRYRLEPLVGVVRSGGLISNPPLTMATMETQLAYDQRELKALQDAAEGIRQSLNVYQSEPRSASNDASPAPPSRSQAATSTSGETVMPQISEGFIDRLITITRDSADVKYRQLLVDDYRKAVTAVVPAQTAVAYDMEVLEQLRRGTGGGGHVSQAQVDAELTSIRGDVRKLVEDVNEIYRALSNTLGGLKQLYTVSSPPVVRTERSVSLPRLFLYGVLVLLLALPLIVAICLVHNRVREEDAAESYEAAGE